MIMNANWFDAQGGEKRGPVLEDHLRTLLIVGALATAPSGWHEMLSSAKRKDEQ